MDNVQVISDASLEEPTLLTAGWRYRWLVLATLALGVALSLVFVAVREDTYEASAELFVEDPRTVGVFATGTSTRPERYLLDQMELLRSRIVADRAAELVPEIAPEVELTADELQQEAQILGQSDTDLIVITFSATDAETAQVGANALAQAYQDLQSNVTSASSRAALDQVDSALAGLESQLDDLGAQIAGLSGSIGSEANIDEQLDEALTELVALQASLSSLEVDSDTEATGASASRIRVRLDDLLQQLQTVEVIRRINAADPSFASLLEERASLVERKNELAASRDQLLVNAQLQSDGVAHYSPATAAEPSNAATLPRTLAVGLALGLLAGLGAAYLLAIRRRVFTNRSQPETLLRSPLLADVPDFEEEGIKTALPVTQAARSAAAEAYRFAAASLDIRMRSESMELLVVLSALNGTGKTTATANLALAAARQGHKVLVLDADFGDQQLSRLLGKGEFSLQMGLTDAVEGNVPLAECTQRVHLGNDVELDLLGRGRRPTIATDFFRSPDTQAFLESLKSEYDLIFMDAPPLMQIAYASTIAGYADAAVVVVNHGSPVSELEDVVSRLSFIRTPAAGYLYNRAPLRREMTRTEGSMKDVVGDMGFTVPPKTRA